MDLDSNLFSPKADIDAYMLNGFEGEQEINLPDGEYIVRDSLINRIDIPYLNDNGETSLLSAVYVGDTSRIGKDSVILYLHGNSGNIDFYWNRTRLLAHVGGKHRLGVLVIDYPGYGLSEGEPTVDNLIRAADGSADWLQDCGLEEGQLILYGFSLGSIPALQTESVLQDQAQNGPLCDKVILENPIGSIQTMVEDASGLSFDASFFTSFHDNSNIEAIASVLQPVFIFHAIEDNFLSMNSHGIPLRDAYQGVEMVFRQVPEAGHGDLPGKMGFEEYLRSLEQFIFN